MIDVGNLSFFELTASNLKFGRVSAVIAQLLTLRIHFYQKENLNEVFHLF